MTEALPASNIPFMRHLDVARGRWPPVPPEAVSWMLPELEPLARDMAAAILSEVPEYGQPDDDSYARVVHQVARDAVHRFAARVADPAMPGESRWREMFHDIGRVEAAAGRSLDALHTALRVGARVTWQRLREKAREGGGDTDVFARLGESIFRYLDELAAACRPRLRRGRAEFAGEAERLRRGCSTCWSDPPTPPETVAGLAATIGWRLPRRVVAVALAAPASPCSGSAAVRRSRPTCWSTSPGREPCLLMPDPTAPGRRRQLEDGLASGR